ncbi:hypothetical protein LJK88_06200 [Paenibacillus sp. P26]|nr:hypothetical protein LJK88_06200 [Paenibacillus sp. P26]
MDAPAATDGVNQLYFFHPGASYTEGDDRHASPYGEVLLHRDTVIQLWAVPTAAEGIAEALIGRLPKGKWSFGERLGRGRLGNLYVAFHLLNGYSTEEKADRISVVSPLDRGLNGIVVEIFPLKEAVARGIGGLAEFQTYTEKAAPCLQPKPGAAH